MNLLNDFLKHKTIDDICLPVEGELEELATKQATYFYGNGELIISPVNENQPEEIYLVDTYGNKKVLSQFS